MIVVTGMHRSGTSMICQLLAACSIPFGDRDEFLPADAWNPKGYFEQKDILDLNSRMVTGMCRSTAGTESSLGKLLYGMMPPLASIERRSRRMVSQMQELGRKYEGYGVKDPRFCLTIRFWREIVDIENCVVCLRHPRSAVDSLWRRQRYPRLLGFEYWRYHMHSLLAGAAGVKCVVVSFEALCSGNAEAEADVLRRGLGLDLPTQVIMQRHGDIFDRGMVHHQPPTTAVLHPRTERLWQVLLKMRRDCVVDGYVVPAEATCAT